MADRVPVKAFSPEDMKRRRSLSVAMALALIAFVVIIFIPAIFKLNGGN